MYQRNVIASFDTRRDATAATEQLLQAGLRNIHQLRILPPPTVRSTSFEKVVVSAIVDSDQAQHAEEILRQRGHLDLTDDQTHHRLMQVLRRREPLHQAWRAPRSFALPDLTRSTYVAVGTALLTSLALLWGTRKWLRTKAEHHLGRANGKNSRRVHGRGMMEREYRGSGAKRFQDWREHGAAEAIETGHVSETMYDQIAGSSQSGNSGLAVRVGVAGDQIRPASTRVHEIETAD